MLNHPDSARKQAVIRNLVLITGGAKAGKSTLAEKLAAKDGAEVIYLATMPVLKDDPELMEKLARHRSRRPDNWQTIEATRNIDETVSRMENTDKCMVIDCLSAYVSNMLLAAADARSVEKTVTLAIKDLLTALRSRDKVRFFIVTNEVGWSVVPDNKLARDYRELLGIANQMIASAADTVYLCCSGLHLKLKGSD